MFCSLPRLLGSRLGSKKSGLRPPRVRLPCNVYGPTISEPCVAVILASVAGAAAYLATGADGWTVGRIAEAEN